MPRGAGLWPALLLLCLPAAAAPPLKGQPHFRRPVAAAWIEPGKLLAVANSRSGSVSVVDVISGTVRCETIVGEKLSDITSRPGGGRLLAVDELQNELLLLENDGQSVRVINRLPVSPFPVSVVISATGGRIAIASLWSRKLSIFEPNIDLPGAAGQLRLLTAIDLPFNPRRLLVLPGDKLLVADAFGGGLAVIDLENARLIRTHQFPGSIRGMAATSNGRMIVIAEQSLHRAAGPDGGGSVTENRFRFIAAQTLVDPTLTMESAELTNYRAQGDIEQLALTRSAQVVAVLGGTDEIAFVPGQRIKVGQRLVAVVPNTDSSLLVAVNQLSDSISVIRMTGRSAERRQDISLGPTPELAPADRGEALFFTSPLATGWMSCHSCHTDGHTSGKLADTLGDGTEGTPKRIPTLLGTRLTDPWAWNGQVRNLNEQVRKSLETTMHAPNVTTQEVDDIAAFLHTLPPPPPLQPKVAGTLRVPSSADQPSLANDGTRSVPTTLDDAQLARGESLFRSLGCAKCHVPPLTYTSPDAYDVGLADEKGLRKFNPPSLRGVSQGYSFFHDGRAKKLDEVFTVHGHQLERPLEKIELADLLRFLRSL